MSHFSRKEGRDMAKKAKNKNEALNLLIQAFGKEKQMGIRQIRRMASLIPAAGILRSVPKKYLLTSPVGENERVVGTLSDDLKRVQIGILRLLWKQAHLVRECDFLALHKSKFPRLARSLKNELKAVDLYIELLTDFFWTNVYRQFGGGVVAGQILVRSGWTVIERGVAPVLLQHI